MSTTYLTAAFPDRNRVKKYVPAVKTPIHDPWFQVRNINRGISSFGGAVKPVAIRSFDTIVPELRQVTRTTKRKPVKKPPTKKKQKQITNTIRKAQNKKSNSNHKAKPASQNITNPLF